MGSQFDAVRGRQGGVSYYVTTMRFGELARNVGYAERELGDGAEMSPELYRQRKLNIKRVREEMKPYLLNNPDHFFSAVAVEVIRPGDQDHEIRFVPSLDNPDFGRILFDGTELLQAVDGQHRLKTIQLAIDEDADLAKESIAVVLLPHRSVRRSQQLFSDLNRYAKTPSKTLNILFEHRQFEANVAKAWAKYCVAFNSGRTNMETNSLVVKSKHVITLSVLYECVRDLIAKDYEKKPWADGRQMEAEAERVGRQFSEWYDEAVVPSLPDLKLVIEGQMRPVKLREVYVYPHAVGWRAIAKAVRAARDQRPNGWKDIVQLGLAAVDWRITNKEWEGSALVAGAMANRRQNIVRAGTVVALKLGLDVSDTEAADLVNTLKNIDPAATLPEPAVREVRASA